MGAISRALDRLERAGREQGRLPAELRARLQAFTQAARLGERVSARVSPAERLEQLAGEAEEED